MDMCVGVEEEELDVGESEDMWEWYGDVGIYGYMERCGHSGSCGRKAGMDTNSMSTWENCDLRKQ